MRLAERYAGVQVPYTTHISEHVVRTRWSDYVQVFRVGGSSFESADDATINLWHERLGLTWRNLASNQVGIWTHIVRRREREYPQGTFGSAFAARLDARYRERVTGERLMVNDLYIAVVYRSTPTHLTSWTARILAKTQERALRLEMQAALEACDKIRLSMVASLDRYEIEPLGLYAHQGQWYSSVLEFFGFLVNGEWQPVPLPRASIADVLTTSRTIFGVEVIEYRPPTVTMLGAMLGIKEYPTPTVPGMFQSLLSAPFPLILTQSFTFLSKGASAGLLQRQYARMNNAGDFAVSQAAQLKEALDGLAGDEFVMGDHHFSLQVLTDPFERYDLAEVIRQQRILNDRVSLARRMLADANLTVAREDLALEAAYWAQLPGYFARRLRKSPITSRNFAAMAPLHNYPIGRARGNHWGDALTLLITSARSPYYLSLHASDPNDLHGGSRRDVGHTFICGPTGTGKTVIIGFLIAMLTKFGAHQVIIDKDRGLEILVRALGGEYLPLRNGIATGCNPLQLDPTPANVDFLKSWLRLLAGASAGALDLVDDADLEMALRGTLALDAPSRRLSRLIEFLDPTSPDGVYALLSPWCEITQGEYAWAFDQETDRIGAHIAAHSLIGFDCTDILAHAVVRAPVTAYLLHRIGERLGTGRLVCFMDEFQSLMSDPTFARFADSSLPTWRKLDGVLCLATQSPRKVIESPIARSVIEQTPTKIYLPNLEATREDYVEGMGLTEREFRLIRDMEPGSRRFLVKQGRHSVVCELDLQGMEAEVSVLSARASSIARLERLMQERGRDPSAWLDAFLQGATPSGESKGSLITGEAA